MLLLENTPKTVENVETLFKHIKRAFEFGGVVDCIKPFLQEKFENIGFIEGLLDSLKRDEQNSSGLILEEIYNLLELLQDQLRQIKSANICVIIQGFSQYKIEDHENDEVASEFSSNISRLLLDLCDDDADVNKKSQIIISQLEQAGLSGDHLKFLLKKEFWINHELIRATIGKKFFPGEFYWRSLVTSVKSFTKNLMSEEEVNDGIEYQNSEQVLEETKERVKETFHRGQKFKSVASEHEEYIKKLLSELSDSKRENVLDRFEKILERLHCLFLFKKEESVIEKLITSLESKKNCGCVYV